MRPDCSCQMRLNAHFPYYVIKVTQEQSICYALLKKSTKESLIHPPGIHWSFHICMMKISNRMDPMGYIAINVSVLYSHAVSIAAAGRLSKRLRVAAIQFIIELYAEII